MRKILIAFGTLIFSIFGANAGFNYDTAHKCMYSHAYWDWTGGRQLVHCGKNNGKCNGYLGRKSIEKHLLHGNKYTYWANDGDPWWCCNGTSEKAGELKRAASFEVAVPVIVDFEHGSCTYNRKEDICGNIIEDRPCTEPTTCARGIILRNGVCVPPCDDGFVFESENSNRCIPCAETERQAIVGTGYKKECKKCKSYEILDKDEMKCKVKDVPKDAPKDSITTNENGETIMTNSDGSKSIVLTKTAQDAMRKCWQCPGADYYKQCVLHFNNNKNTMPTDEIKEKCKITD